MGLDIDFDFQEGLSSATQQFKGPFDRFNKAPIELLPEDFPDGFWIMPFKDGKERPKDAVQLAGNWLPFAPFTFGGKQRLVRNQYPGQSEPTVHVLGSEEDNTIIKGRLRTKHIPLDTETDFRPLAREQQKRIDLLRIQGLLCRFSLGTWQRFGFVEATSFQLKTMADIRYSIDLFIVGFNPPTDCRVLKISRTIPFDINKDLIVAASQFQTTQTENLEKFQSQFNRSFFDQMNTAIGEVAEAIGLVTSFIDNVLSIADDIAKTIDRANGLILNAKANMSAYQRTVGAFNPVGNTTNPAVIGIGAGYINANFLSVSQSEVSSLLDLTSRLGFELSQFREKAPLQRHLIKAGDTLQKLATKFYGNADAWQEIYDHNNLGTTVLIVADVLEIPRLENA